MDANSAVDMIVSTVKTSNLNFLIQESPFSLQINLRKTFIKNKNGMTLQPVCKNDTACKIDQKVQIKKMEQENSTLHDFIKRLEDETREAFNKLNINLENENTVLSKKKAKLSSKR